jgi:hypothetical protein
MSSKAEIRATNLREVLTLQRHHFQHIETERYWFMSVYTAIIGVMVGLILKIDLTTQETYKIWSLSFLIVLTFIGFFINVRWMQTLDFVSGKIRGIAATLGVEDEVKFEPPSNGIWKILRTRYLFLFYYVIVFFGLITLLFIQ